MSPILHRFASITHSVLTGFVVAPDYDRESQPILMNTITAYRYASIFWISLLSTVILFVFHWNEVSSLADEGVHWYASQRILFGGVPILDYSSYDPGRYYWTAALMWLFGDSDFFLYRVGAATFQFLGLYVSLLIISYHQKNRKVDIFYLMLCSMVLCIWMSTYLLSFNYTVLVCLFFVLIRVVGVPCKQNIFIAGIALGLAAVFGRNLAVYGAFAYLCALAWTHLERNEKLETTVFQSIYIGFFGICLGYLPVLCMFLFVSGFPQAFIKSIQLLVDAGSTNIPLRLPMPWHFSWGQLVSSDTALSLRESRKLGTGLFFVLNVVAILSLAIWLTIKKFRGERVIPIVVALTFLLLFSLHYPFSRASLVKIALTTIPVLITTLALVSSFHIFIKCGLAILVLAMSLFTFNTMDHCTSQENCTEIVIRGDVLNTSIRKYRKLERINHIVNAYAPGEEDSFAVLPAMAFSNAQWQRESPINSLYAVFPRAKWHQKEEIERIKKNRPAFIAVQEAEGESPWNYRHTNPLVYEFIKNNFDEPDAWEPPGYELFTIPRACEKSESVISENGVSDCPWFSGDHEP